MRYANLLGPNKMLVNVQTSKKQCKIPRNFYSGENGDDTYVYMRSNNLCWLPKRGDLEHLGLTHIRPMVWHVLDPWFDTCSACGPTWEPSFCQYHLRTSMWANATLEVCAKDFSNNCEIIWKMTIYWDSQLRSTTSSKSLVRLIGLHQWTTHTAASIFA